MKTKKKICFFGFGYVAQYLYRALSNEDYVFSISVRDAKKQKELLKQGIHSFLFADPKDQENIFAGVTHALISIPPNANGDPVYRAYYSLIKECSTLEWLGYCSTTGVYGDHKGEWVNEESALNPSSVKAQNRLIAEQQWLDAGKKDQIPIQIFRLSGIYGPGRSVIDRMSSGRVQRIEKPGHYFSRIHVEDIVQVMRASFSHGQAGDIFNIADDCPAASSDVIDFAAQLLGISPPPAIPFDKAELSQMAQQFYQDNKRVSNDKMTEILRVELKYPSYREGLHAIYNQ